MFQSTKAEPEPPGALISAPEEVLVSERQLPLTFQLMRAATISFRPERTF